MSGVPATAIQIVGEFPHPVKQDRSEILTYPERELRFRVRFGFSNPVRSLKIHFGIGTHSKMSSSAIQPKLESRLEELMFLAEAISEQVDLIDTFQTEYILPAAKPKKVGSDTNSVDVSAVTEQVKNLVAQFDENSRQRNELAKLESDLARREEKLNGQRKSLTQRFKAEWAQLQLEKLELESLKSLLGDPETLPTEKTAATATAQPEDSGPSIEEVTEKLDDLFASLNETKAENQRLHLENEELREQLRMRPQTSESPDAEEYIAEIFDLKRRLELALDELQESKLELQRLQSVSAPRPITGTTWEEQKQALLQSLENETNCDILLQQPEVILESLRNSEELVKQKDATIKQLEALLKEYEEDSNSEQHHSEKEAHKKLIDESEVIAIEKERLNILEKQWREKIGEAEIELSKERARLSRERAALDEKLRELEGEDNQDDDDQEPEKPKKRKWMERLGLA